MIFIFPQLSFSLKGFLLCELEMCAAQGGRCVQGCVLRFNREHVWHVKRRRSTTRRMSNEEDSRFILLFVIFRRVVPPRGNGFLSVTGEPVPQRDEAQVPPRVSRGFSKKSWGPHGEPETLQLLIKLKKEKATFWTAVKTPEVCPP